MFQIGIIGCILYGILFLACLYRTSVYWVVTKRADLKLLFHCFLSSCVVLEIVYFIGFIVDDRYTTWGYQFHLYSSLLHTMAYAVVILITVLLKLIDLLFEHVMLFAGCCSVGKGPHTFWSHDRFCSENCLFTYFSAHSCRFLELLGAT